MYIKEALSINALHACVYIYIQQLRSSRAPTLWFIDQTVATCHIQYTCLSLCQHGQRTKILKVYENGSWLDGIPIRVGSAIGLKLSGWG